MTQIMMPEETDSVQASFRLAEGIGQRLRLAVAHKNDLEIGRILQETARLFKNSTTVTQYKLLTEAVELQCAHIVTLLRVALLENESALVRHEAAFGLGLLGDSSDIVLLANAMLSDPHLMVRHEAAIALGAIGDATALASLAEAVHDPEISVAESARFGLEQVLVRLGTPNLNP